MRSEWKECMLGDIMTLKRGFDLPQDKRNLGKVPIFSSSGITGAHDVSMCAPPGVITGRYGTIGKVFYSETPYWPLNTTLFVEDFKNSHPKYIFYLLKTVHWEQFTGKSAVPGVNRNDVHKLSVVLPPLPEQKAIAAVLSALDDKIELNNRINQKLEEMVQAIFKSWFVDFEPFQDGEFLESELGLIPKGWRAGKIADICCYRVDKISVDKLSEETYYSTENMLPNKEGAVVASGMPSIEQTTACKIGDTLISNIRPYFKKILYCVNEGGCSTDVLCFSPQKPLYSLFLYMTLYNDTFFNFVMAGSKGTKMPRGDKKQIMQYPITVPSNDAISEFNTVISPVIHLVASNKDEIRNLTNLRNTLLPKLLSGEIKVNIS